MAEHPLTLSRVRVQSLPADLAAAHAWVALKAVCGHQRPFFDDGPAALPVEPVAPLCPVLAGAAEVVA